MPASFPMGKTSRYVPQKSPHPFPTWRKATRHTLNKAQLTANNGKANTSNCHARFTRGKLPEVSEMGDTGDTQPI